MQKHILITGAASGIGRYIAEQYSVDNKYVVVGIDINHIDISNCLFFQCDLNNEKNTHQVFDKIEKIDLAINCAGVSSLRKELIKFSQSEIIEAWQENFIPTFNSLKNEIQVMKKNHGGKIINIASISGEVGMKNFLAYGAAKAAIINMTKVAAIENAEQRIMINSISPATIDTPMIRKKYNDQLRDYSEVYYTKDCGKASDIFSVVKMLEENNFMTGNNISLNGGLTDLLEI